MTAATAIGVAWVVVCGVLIWQALHDLWCGHAQDTAALPPEDLSAFDPLEQEFRALEERVAMRNRKRVEARVWRAEYRSTGECYVCGRIGYCSCPGDLTNWEVV